MHRESPPPPPCHRLTSPCRKVIHQVVHDDLEHLLELVLQWPRLGCAHDSTGPAGVFRQIRVGQVRERGSCTAAVSWVRSRQHWARYVTHSRAHLSGRYENCSKPHTSSPQPAAPPYPPHTASLPCTCQAGMSTAPPPRQQPPTSCAPHTPHTHTASLRPLSPAPVRQVRELLHAMPVVFRCRDVAREAARDEVRHRGRGNQVGHPAQRLQELKEGERPAAVRGRVSRRRRGLGVGRDLVCGNLTLSTPTCSSGRPLQCCCHQGSACGST